MEHNLEDPLNLESSMGSMDFDHSGVVVSQEDIALETTGHEADIPMEFEHIEEQPMLMDTGSEEIIVSDFMNDQYTLQEYSVQDEPVPETSGLIESNELIVMSSQNESMIDLQFDPESSQGVTQDVTTQPKFISVKAAVAPRKIKNETVVAGNPPRQVAIAPKPPKLVPTVSKGFTTGKQYAIAPKPVALVTNKNASLVKKMSLASVLQSSGKSTQLGKQIVMMPAGGMQKIKLVTSGSGVPTVQYVRNANNDQAEIIKNVSSGNSQKPVMAKVFVQAGQQNADNWSQPAVITKLMPQTSNLTPHTRYVMQQKTVPISIASNKVLLASPTKQGVKFSKKQIISIKSPTPKLMPVTSQAAATSKKVVISSNPNQNVILKTTAPPKTAQVSKDGSLVVQAQPTQLHQINVPGKGIQYIRLITNPTTAQQKVVAKAHPPAPTVPSKGFVLTDGKGNVIQMTARKLMTGQPPPLVLTGNLGAVTKVTAKPQKKLVRIAPVAMKPSQVAQSRSAQSLLAPLSPMGDSHLEEVSDLLESRNMHEEELTEEQVVERDEEVSESKAALRALIADTVAGHAHDMQAMHEVEVDFERQETPIEDDSGSNMDQHDSSNRSEEHSLIVIPSSFGKAQNQMRDDKNYSNMDEGLPYLSPKASQQSESDLVSGDHLGLRPRKACNCTKSQCLKLYCDCFANGEFCNGCNCHNCHNNLENEELRQKAIRACLDRNPNAFRPKIGKAKSGGPDIIRRHNKGCNCKRSGCLKNYCECYEAKIACTSMCKCVGCRNVEETLERRRDALRLRDKLRDPLLRPPPATMLKQPCSFMTSDVIEAVCQCLLAAAAADAPAPEPEPLRDVLEEFARCLQDIISASHQSSSVSLLDDSQA
ncbi:protein lin-54 homolog isoform X3 [Trichoplusia ni]|uniref:Protein lin-54 homolog isoform X3 n=1 Tax=Trichoplusia ni TaxID=7111 RepID=A0A7E5X1N2_TRINI|nr:protein lin-54 homolog isoform X3 [Trichoplusia ni]